MQQQRKTRTSSGLRDLEAIRMYNNRDPQNITN